MTEPDPLYTCPYDKSHRIVSSGLQFHLVRCAVHHQNATKLYCKFDSTHVVDRMEYEHHIATCPTRGNVLHGVIMLEPDEPVGTVPLEELKNVEPYVSTENWDEYCSPASTYNPLQDIEKKSVVRTLMVASKSKRKKFRQAERLRLASLEGSSNSANQSLQLENAKQGSIKKPLRSPKKPVQVLSANNAIAADASNNGKPEQSSDESQNDEMTINAAINNLRQNNTRSSNTPNTNINSTKTAASVSCSKNSKEVTKTLQNDKTSERILKSSDIHDDNPTKPDKAVFDYTYQMDNDPVKQTVKVVEKQSCVATHMMKEGLNGSGDSIRTVSTESEDVICVDSCIVDKINSRIAALSNLEKSICDEKTRLSELTDLLKKAQLCSSKEKERPNSNSHPNNNDSIGRSGTLASILPRYNIGRGRTILPEGDARLVMKQQNYHIDPALLHKRSTTTSGTNMNGQFRDAI